MGRTFCRFCALFLLASMIKSDDAAGENFSTGVFHSTAVGRHEKILGCGPMHFHHGHLCKDGYEDFDAISVPCIVHQCGCPDLLRKRRRADDGFPVTLIGVQATSESRNKRQVVGPEVLPSSVARISFTMCQANLNDMVPCTVSPLAADCFQAKGTCCRGSCVCSSYPNPCIVEDYAYMGRRKRAALARPYPIYYRGCKLSCLRKCNTPSCLPGSSRNSCKKACLQRCLEGCDN
ncbi:hypothetical protein MRX96_032605 [Rhipicephalus microplus]